MNFQRIAGVLLMFGFLFTAGILSAQSEYPLNRTRPWADACERAIQDKVISNNPRVQKVNFDQRSEFESQQSNVDMLIRGDGSFTRHNDEVEHFKFECVYNTRDARVVRADYSVQEAGFTSGVDADPTKGWVQACQNAVRNDVKRDYQESESISFSTARESELPNSQNRLFGDGEFRQRNGAYRKFSYECIYNMRDGRVANSNFKIK